MPPGGFTLRGSAVPIGELLIIVGQQLRDLEGGLGNQLPQKTSCGRGGLVLEDLHINPAGGTLDSGEEVVAMVLIRHLGQVLDIYIYKARSVVLDGLVLGLPPFFPRQQGFQVSKAITTQAAVQPRA